MATNKLIIVDGVLIPENVLEWYRADIAAVQSCKTIADVRRVEPQLRVIGLPGASLDEMEDEECYIHPETGEWTDLVDDGPWDASVIYGDYAWPPELETISMDWLDEALVAALLEGGAAEYEEISGPLDWFTIPKAETLNAIAIAEALGHPVRLESEGA